MESGGNEFSSQLRKQARNVSRGRKKLRGQEEKIGVYLCALLWLMIHLQYISYKLYFEQSFLVLLSGSIVTLAIFYYFDGNVQHKKRYLIEGIALGLAGIVYLWQKKSIDHFKQMVFRSWFLDQWENVAYHGINRRYITLLLVVLFGGLAIWGHEKARRHVLMSLECIILILVIMLSGMPLTKGMIICMLCYMLLIITKLIYGMKYHTRGSNICKEIIVYLFPMYLMLSVGIALLPVKAQPLSSKTVDRVEVEISKAWHQIKNSVGYARLQEKIEELAETSYAYYEYSKTVGEHKEIEEMITHYEDAYGLQLPEWGSSTDKHKIKFSERKNTGEPLVFNNEALFTLTINSSPLVIYLAGDEKADYKDSTWHYAPNIEAGDFSEKECELLSLLYGEGLIKDATSIDEGHMRISYGPIATRLLLYPRNTYAIKQDEEIVPIDETGRRFKLKRSKALNEKVDYEISFFGYNKENRSIAAYLRGLDHFDYREHIYNFKDYAREKGWQVPHAVDQASEEVLADNLHAYAEAVRRIYCELPEEMPERVKELAHRITENCDNQYDRLKAIEAYLHQYSYTTTPMPLENGEDFVDHFLFVSRSGYCSHFASAMVILARSEGIPTRVVDGYAVFTPGGGRRIHVRDSAAHSWVEAYFEGLGWVSFEPTPATTGYMDNEEGMLQRGLTDTANGVVQAPFSTPTAIEVKEESEGDREETVQKEGEAAGLKEDGGNKEGAEDKAAMPKKEYSMRKIMGILAALVGLGITSVITFICVKPLCKWRQKRKEIAYQYEHHLKKVDHKLKKQGLSRKKNETLTAYLKRLEKEMDASQKPYVAIYKVYMAYRYGEEAITIEALERLLTYEKTKGYKARQKKKDL